MGTTVPSSSPVAASAVSDVSPITDEAAGKAYPQVQIDPPPYLERPGRMVLLHGFLLIPHYFVLPFLVIGQYIGLTVAWSW